MVFLDVDGGKRCFLLVVSAGFLLVCILRSVGYYYSCSKGEFYSNSIIKYFQFVHCYEDIIYLFTFCYVFS